MAEQKEHGMSLSEKEQQELLEKYDPEAGTRKLAGWAGIIAFAGLLSFSLFQLYTAIFGVFPAQIQRSVHLGFALGLIFLLFPATKNLKAAGTCKVAWYDAVLAVLGAGVGVYWVINYETIVTGIGLITTVDFYVGLLAVLLVLEATRRAVGLPITIIGRLVSVVRPLRLQSARFFVPQRTDAGTAYSDHVFYNGRHLGNTAGRLLNLHFPVYFIRRLSRSNGCGTIF